MAKPASGWAVQMSPEYPPGSLADTIYTMLGVVGGLPDTIAEEDGVVREWIEILRGFGRQDVFDACQVWLGTYEDPPTAADILLQIKKVTKARSS